MTFKANMAKAEKDLAALKAAMAKARFAADQSAVIIVNEPLDEEMLAPYRLEGLDPTQTIEIGSPQPPGGWLGVDETGG